MKDKVNNKIEENNKNYEREIKDVFNNIKFAKIESRKLKNSACVNWLIFLCCFITIANILFLTYYLHYNKLNTLVYILVALNFMFLILSYVLWLKLVKKNKYKYCWYFLFDGYCYYQIWIENEQNIMRTICNLTDNKILYVDKEDKKRKCILRIDDETPIKITGFNDFFTKPEELLKIKYFNFYKNNPNDFYSKKHLYKRKRVFMKNTYYYYPKLKSVIECFYPRGIKIKNNVINYACSQKIVDNFSKKIYIVESYEYKFSLVNNNNFKIHIPEFVEKFSAKKNFKLPQQCPNIIYDSELNNNNAFNIEAENELLPLCDASGKIVGTVDSNKAHLMGAYHKGIHIYIISNKQILNVFTLSNNEISPNAMVPYLKVDANVNEETDFTAYKKANEVLDNKIKKNEIKFLFTYKQTIKNKNYIDNEFVDVFIINKALSEKNIILEESDFGGFKFIKLEDFFNKVENNYDKEIYIDKKEYNKIKQILNNATN